MSSRCCAVAGHEIPRSHIREVGGGLGLRSIFRTYLWESIRSGLEPESKSGLVFPLNIQQTDSSEQRFTLRVPGWLGFRYLPIVYASTPPSSSTSPLLLLQVQDADLEPMLGPSEADAKRTFFVDRLGREFGRADDETTGFWDRVEGDYEGP